MKLEFAAISLFAIFTTINGIALVEFLNEFIRPLPSNAEFLTVGKECSFNSVLFPNMYLMYKKGTTDRLELKEGDPRTSSDNDWRGLWTIEKYINSKSARTEYRIKDQKDDKFMIKIYYGGLEGALFLKGESKLVQGVLWHFEEPKGSEGVETIIRFSSTQTHPSNIFYLRVTSRDELHPNGTRAVDLDNLNNSPTPDLRKWKIVCK